MTQVVKPSTRPPERYFGYVPLHLRGGYRPVVDDVGRRARPVPPPCVDLPEGRVSGPVPLGVTIVGYLLFAVLSAIAAFHFTLYYLRVTA